MPRTCLLFFCFSLGLFFSSYKMRNTPVIEYLPLGDSYTICTGVSEKESWPFLLADLLNQNKLECHLLDNPARNGFTTKDLIERELPLVKDLKPNFVTLLIGVNDWVRRVPKRDFEQNLRLILDEIQANLPHKRNIILITIPDFGVTPQGALYAYGRNITEGIREFNSSIKREGEMRGLVVVDIFEESRKMGNNKSLVSADGLHPSATGYAIWGRMILPEAIALLNK